MWDLFIFSHSESVKIGGRFATVRIKQICSDGNMTGCSSLQSLSKRSAIRSTGDSPFSQ